MDVDFLNKPYKYGAHRDRESKEIGRYALVKICCHRYYFFYECCLQEVYKPKAIMKNETINICIENKNDFGCLASKSNTSSNSYTLLFNSQEIDNYIVVTFTRSNLILT